MANKDKRIIQTRAGEAQAETHMSFALSQELKDKIKEVAKRHDVSASQLVRRAVEDYLYPIVYVLPSDGVEAD